MSMYRQMSPWWSNVCTHNTMPADFRTGQPEWAATFASSQDPRMTAHGDIARRGTIPHYVPFAPNNPRKIVNVPQ